MKNIILSSVISIVCSTAALFAYHHYASQPIGFIRSGVVLEQYKAMAEANDQFAKEVQQVQINLDTLKKRYEHIRAQENGLSSAEKADWGYRLGIAKNDFEKYNAQASEQMEARKQELTKSVLQKVNLFIQDFGKEKNYKMIMGTTNEGSILYGNDADDLTETVLSGLNEAYEKANGSKEQNAGK